MRTMVNARKYPSTRRGSTQSYLCKKWDDGDITCNCPGWRFKQADKPRGCSHCEWFRQDYWLVTIAEASRVALSGTKYDTITTYGQFLYLIRFRAGETYRPLNTIEEDTASVSVKDEEFAIPDSVQSGRLPRTPTLPKKPTLVPTTNPRRARNAFDEEV